MPSNEPSFVVPLFFEIFPIDTLLECRFEARNVPMVSKYWLSDSLMTRDLIGLDADPSYDADYVDE